MSKIRSITNAVQIQEWQKRILECQASGLKVYEWCAQNGVRRDRYYYWLRKCREQAIEQLPTEIKNQIAVTETDIKPTFKKLEVIAPEDSAAAAITIKLSHATIEITNNANQHTIEAVLTALKSIC